MIMPEYLIDTDISEKQVELDVANFLGFASKTIGQFRILDSNENKTGADCEFNSGIPIYIQFKKTYGLNSISKVPYSERKNAALADRLRVYRNKNKLKDNPSLFFELRKKAKNANNLQHNILLSYHRPSLSYAVYVAPLETDLKKYNANLFSSASGVSKGMFPFKYKNYTINMVNMFRFIPFLRGHISIVPHTTVKTHKHAYAYSTSGDDISWHSPSIISRDPSLFSEFIADRFLSVFSESPRQGEEILQHLYGIVTENTHNPQDIFQGSTVSERIHSHGKWLYKMYGINQYILCI